MGENFQLQYGLTGFYRVLSSYEISTFFLVFICLVHHTVHIRTKTCMKFVFKQRFLKKKKQKKKQAFLDISSQNCAEASKIFQNIAKLKSITMQMISDFMHFDTIALRQKKMQFEKWTVIMFVQCILWPIGKYLSVYGI